MFQSDALLLNRIFGLTLRKNAPGMEYSAGFPKWMEDAYLKQILFGGYHLVRIREAIAGPYVRERYISDVYSVDAQLSD